MAEQDKNTTVKPVTFERGAQVPTQKAVPPMPTVKAPAQITQPSKGKK